MVAQTRISGVLTSLAGYRGERLTVSEIVAVLRDRAFALLVVLLGLPNCLPMPPPIPFICGLLLGLVAVQIVAGRPTPWLPKALLARSIRAGDVEKAVGRALPIMQRLERWSRPRMAFLAAPASLRVVGAALFVFATGLLVAPPVIGQIPLGIATCLVGLGLVERDGILVVGGGIVGAFGLALSFGFVYAVIAGIEHLV